MHISAQKYAWSVKAALRRSISRYIVFQIDTLTHEIVL